MLNILAVLCILHEFLVWRISSGQSVPEHNFHLNETTASYPRRRCKGELKESFKGK